MRFFCKVRSFKIKFFAIATVVIGLYLLLSYIFVEVWFGKGSRKGTNVSVSLNYVVMHFDLKRTPLKLSYLDTLLPLLKEYKVNSLLMEYEDMFPYDGKLVNLSAENCYKKPELKQFLSTAVKLGFEIIPLVQTFGHLEYALKLSEFQHLRETSLYPDSICPSKPESIALITDMLDQILDFHNEIRPLKYIHIGCDEVFHMKKCQDCKKRGLKITDIFLHHVKTLSDGIKSQYADTTVLIWDDMLRGIKPNKWNKFDQLTNVQPVYWDYGPDLELKHANLFKYHMNFPHIWIASAFKGADGRTATFPNIRNRYLNVYSWMNSISNYKFGGEHKVYDFRGIILTGWSRYSHMDPPCELLPVSLPSLILNLMVVQKFRSGFIEFSDDNNDFVEEFLNKHLLREMDKSINCIIDIDNIDTYYSECDFDGRELYDVLKYFTSISNDLKDIYNDSELSLEFVEFYSQFDLINKNTLAKNVKLINKYLREVSNFENRAAQVMSKYYERDYINEYINYKTFYIKKKLHRLQEIYNSYYNVSVWQRRPINITYFTIT